jgi:hypothetical protein
MTVLCSDCISIFSLFSCVSCVSWTPGPAYPARGLPDPAYPARGLDASDAGLGATSSGQGPPEDESHDHRSHDHPEDRPDGHTIAEIDRLRLMVDMNRLRDLDGLERVGVWLSALWIHGPFSSTLESPEPEFGARGGPLYTSRGGEPCSESRIRSVRASRSPREAAWEGRDFHIWNLEWSWETCTRSRAAGDNGSSAKRSGSIGADPITRRSEATPEGASVESDRSAQA